MEPTNEGEMRHSQLSLDCGFLLKLADQEAQCFAMLIGTIHISQIESLGFCLDSEEEALDEEICRTQLVVVHAHM